MTASESGRHLLAPRDPASDRVSVWVGVVDAPVEGLELSIAGTKRPLAAWDLFQAAGRSLRSQLVTADGLAADGRHEVALVDRGEVVATAVATTLPAALPTPNEPPFTMLLGSCFCAAQDAGGSVGGTVARMPVAARASVSVLSGDQVYLDSPAMHFLAHTHEPDELAGKLLQHYVDTWGQTVTLGGFRRVLAAGTNVFSSDDHDFWNNAPNPAPYVRDTWTEAGRAAWLETANRLFAVFQAPAPGTTFRVGRLSFFVADTRRDRTADRARLMTPEQLSALGGWVKGLDGPGVLVVGQPIFVDKAGWKGNLTDWSMADFGQYADLVRLLAATPHDLLVLTGDVHFGRVAVCSLPTGRRIVEAIASPFALVHPAAAGKWADAPQWFPAVPVPGLSQSPVQTLPYRRTGNHFMTLGFSGVGNAVRATATAWPIGAGVVPSGQVAHTVELH